MPAAAAWSRQLQAWALPPELVDAAPESPYGWPVGMFRRRAQLERERMELTPTQERVEAGLGDSGVLLDVGAGTGRMAVPWAERGHLVIAVEPDAGMAAGLRASAADAATEIEVIEQRWPEAAAAVGPADVAVCANVVYDVADIGPFVAALDCAAPRVVVELTARHPWADLSPYYLALHGLRRPPGPTVADFLAVVEEVIGTAPRSTGWRRDPRAYFVSWEEILAYYGKRLLIGPERYPELRALLEPAVTWWGGRVRVGGLREMATVWW